MPDYAATKAALLNLTVSLSKFLARSGITVNTVSPGIVVTPGVEQFYRQEASRRGWGQDWVAIEAGVLAEILDNPVGRLGRPSEVADLVAFVASPLAGVHQRGQPAYRRGQHRCHMTAGYQSMPWTSRAAPLIIDA